jgi:tetratricopeptide (TPR) repeat protein
MLAPLALLKFVARATLNAIGGGVGGDFAVEVLPDIARDVWRWWGKDRSEAERKADVHALVQAPAGDVQQQVKEIVREVAGDRPPDERLTLETYLKEIPSVARQSLRRRDDPRGVTVPANMPLQKAEDLLPFLPQRLPRFKPGERPLANVDWELVKLLGVGGFGEVWQARNPHAPHLRAALKFCLDPAAREQLLKHEAAVLARVMSQGDHPGIVRLRHTYLSADPPCLEYEYINGGDLAGAIHAHQAARGPLPPDVATKIVLRLARAVGHAHKLSPPIVHRDLKPANVLVRTKEGGSEFLITDFGIGGVVASQALEQTRRGTTSQPLPTSLKGAHTPLYASPEQKRGDPPDPRDDIHALGVIWYQLLIGDFSEGAPAGGAWRKHLRGRGVSDRMLDLIESCFEARAEHRPPNAAAVAEQIDAAIKADTDDALRRKAEAEEAARKKAEEEEAARRKAEQERIEKEKAERERIEKEKAACVERGLAHVEEGKAEEALAAFGEALRLDPNAAIVYFHRGQVHEKMKDLDRALSDYSQAIQLDPNQAPVLNARGRTYLRKEESDLALADLDRALELAPELAEAYHHRGRAHAAKGNHEQAAADYTQAIKLGLKSGEVYYHRGLARARLHKSALAATDFSKAIKENPRNPELYVTRGLTYLDRWDYAGAIADFTKAIRLDKGYTAGYEHRGRAYLESGKYGMAVNDLTRVIEQGPPRAEILDARAWAHCMKKQFDQAVADATEAIRLDPRSAAAYFHRSRAQAGKGALEQAVADATEAIRLDPKAAHHEARGLAYYGMGKWELAIADFNEALRQEPRNAALVRLRDRACAKKEKSASNAEDDRLQETAQEDYNERLWGEPGFGAVSAGEIDPSKVLSPEEAERFFAEAEAARAEEVTREEAEPADPTEEH